MSIPNSQLSNFVSIGHSSNKMWLYIINEQQDSTLCTKIELKNSAWTPFKNVQIVCICKSQTAHAKCPKFLILSKLPVKVCAHCMYTVYYIIYSLLLQCRHLNHEHFGLFQCFICNYLGNIFMLYLGPIQLRN